MSNRVVEIGNPGFLSIENRQLVIQRDGQRVGSVPMEDLGVLILDSHSLSYTQELIRICADNNTAVIWCNDKHMPSGMLVAFDANSLHTKTLREQIDAKLPTKKRIWQQIVAAKLAEQAKHLEERGLAAAPLRTLAAEVRSGDAGNREGQGAQLYWEQLFGSNFSRERDVPGVNAFLNYGYAILRACTARAVVGTGLHPAIGVHHRNQYNSYCLADDLMEPLRPLVDRFALRAIEEFGRDSELTPPGKRLMLELTQATVTVSGKRVPLLTGLQSYAAAVRKALGGLAQKLPIPTV